MADLEARIKELFMSKPQSSISASFWNGFKFIASFFVIFGLIFMTVNFPAYFSRTNYFLSKNKKTISVQTPLAPAVSEKPQQPAYQPEIEVQSHRIVAPAINLDAPIIWQVQPDQILSALKKGIAHYGPTSLPGQNGNVFLTGHSSNYWWDDGLFKQVFALLDKLNNGDKIYLGYDGKTYVYQVEKKIIVQPNSIEVLNPGDHSILSLMTCYPVGTTLNRLIIQAKQIYPDQNNDAPQQPLAKPKSLPIIR